MSKKITPLTTTTTKGVLTPSVLESPETISDQEFGENFEQGKFYPISQDSGGKGGVSFNPTYYDRRNGMRCSFLAENKE